MKSQQFLNMDTSPDIIGRISVKDFKALRLRDPRMSKTNLSITHNSFLVDHDQKANRSVGEKDKEEKK